MECPLGFTSQGHAQAWNTSSLVNFFLPLLLLSPSLHLREKNMCHMLPESLVLTLSFLGRKGKKIVARVVHSLVPAPVRVDSWGHAGSSGFPRQEAKQLRSFLFFHLFPLLPSWDEGQGITWSPYLSSFFLAFLSSFSVPPLSEQRVGVYLCLSVQATVEKKQSPF